MAKFFKITDPGDLDSVNNEIHDCYFDINDITLDQRSSVLSFRFRRLVTQGKHGWRDFISTSKMSPAFECFLKISHVESYSINDTEKIGTYDFDILKYDSLNRSITVLTNTPIGIKIIVRRLEISVEVKDCLFK